MEQSNLESEATPWFSVYSITETEICVDDCAHEDFSQIEQHAKWTSEEVPIGNHSESSGVFSLAERPDETSSIWRAAAIVAVGGDSRKPDDAERTAAFTLDGGKTGQAAANSTARLPLRRSLRRRGQDLDHRLDRGAPTFRPTTGRTGARCIPIPHCMNRPTRTATGMRSRCQFPPPVVVQYVTERETKT